LFMGHGLVLESLLFNNRIRDRVILRHEATAVPEAVADASLRMTSSSGGRRDSSSGAVSCVRRSEGSADGAIFAR
jgi:hypothetical protein